MKPSLNEWFVFNLKVGGLSLGGAGRILLYQESVVDRWQWMSEEEYQKMMTLVQVLPGPNLCNLSAYLGFLCAGWSGAIAGMAALTLPGALLIVLMALFLNFQNPSLQLLFQGFALASVVTFSLFMWRLLKGVPSSTPRRHQRVHNGLRILVVVATGVATLQNIPLLYILLVAGLFCLLLELDPT